MGVIPNPKKAFIFPILCILALIFPILIKCFPKCVGKGSFPNPKLNHCTLIFLFGLTKDKDCSLPLSTKDSQKEKKEGVSNHDHHSQTDVI